MPDYLNYFLRNLYAGQEAKVRTLYMEQRTGSKLGKEYDKAVYCHSIYFTSMQTMSCKMSGWMNNKMESRLLIEIATSSDMQLIPLMVESEEKLMSLLMRIKEENEKAGLKLNIQNTMIMASSPITSCKHMGGKWKQWQDFVFLGSKITADHDCSPEIKRCLLLGRKAMTNLDKCIKKQRRHFADKGLYCQSYGFFQ